MHLDAGREATYFICGRTTVVGGLDIWVDPRIQVWSKIGDSGAVTRATRESHSFVAPAAGPVLFGNYFPNHWAGSGGVAWIGGGRSGPSTFSSAVSRLLDNSMSAYPLTVRPPFVHLSLVRQEMAGLIATGKSGQEV